MRIFCMYLVDSETAPVQIALLTGRNAKDTARVGFEVNGETIGLTGYVAGGDEIVQPRRGSAACEMSVTQGIDLAPGDLYIYSLRRQVEEREDD